jgi:opacity protein-like surface antigen
VEDVYRTSASAFIGRKMGMHWFAQAQGGGGTIRSNRQLYELPTGAQYLVGGSVGYMNQAHTIFLASNRSFGDQYGLGAGSTIVTSASWIWAHPRRSWTVLASASDQWFQARAGNIHGWQALAGISKMLSSHLSCRVEYAYIAYDGRSAFSRELSQNAVRASLEWSPRILRSRR